MKHLSKLHELADKYEKQIKEAIAERFSVSVDELILLTDKEDGVFINEVDTSALCCLALGKESGFLYAVNAIINKNHEELTNFSAKIIT